MNVEPLLPSERVARPERPHPSLGTPFESAVLDGPHEGEADLEGALPAWLEGRLLRTAPALFELGAWRARHWFDALGMVYTLDLRGGRVRFRQRLLESEALTQARAGRMPVSSFATPNQRSFWRRLVEPIPRMTDNANVHVVPTPDGWLAMTETPTQLLLDGDTLEVRRSVRYDDAIGPACAMLAHPEADGDAMINLATHLGRKVEIVPYRQRLGSDQRDPIARIVRDDLPYLHAFGLTPRHQVIVAPPLVASPLSMLWSNRGYIDHFRWRPERATDVYVIDRATGRVRQTEADTFFYFHVANAFDDGDDVVVDVCAYPDDDVVHRLRREGTDRPLELDSHLRRLRIPPTGRARHEVLDDQPLEFPSVSRRHARGRRHRVVWGAAPRTTTGDVSTLRRLDLAEGSTQTFHREHVVYGEPIFVARPGAEREDDGVLLAVGSDLVRRTAELVVLDAANLEPVATARLPIPLPLGFHGSFERG